MLGCVEIFKKYIYILYLVERMCVQRGAWLGLGADSACFGHSQTHSDTIYYSVSVNDFVLLGFFFFFWNLNLLFFYIYC